MTDPTLVVAAGTRSRCPICDHPNTVAMPQEPQLMAHGEWRKAVTFECDRGHCWTTSWTADE